VKQEIVQISVVVPTIQTRHCAICFPLGQVVCRALKTDVEEGFLHMAIMQELVDPKVL